MSRAAGERTSSVALTHSMPIISLVADGGSDVMVPPPSCLNCANTSRYTSATTPPNRKIRTAKAEYYKRRRHCEYRGDQPRQHHRCNRIDAGADRKRKHRGVQANVGEVIAWRNLFWGLSDAMVRDPKPWIGDHVLPNMDPGNAYQIIATMAYTRVKYLIEQTVASGLIYLNSHARDFKNPEIRPYLDQYLRGSNGYKADERVKLLKLLGDCLASEFGGRHELYEINYGGSTEEIRRYCLFGAQASGNADKFKGFAEECMAEYDLDGWKVPDLSDRRVQLSRRARGQISRNSYRHPLITRMATLRQRSG